MTAPGFAGYLANVERTQRGTFIAGMAPPGAVRAFELADGSSLEPPLVALDPVGDERFFAAWLDRGADVAAATAYGDDGSTLVSVTNATRRPPGTYGGYSLIG